MEVRLSKPVRWKRVGKKPSVAVIVTIPDPETSRTVIHHVRDLAPDTPIIARLRYSMHRNELESAGAQIVVDEETNIGHRLAEALDEAEHNLDAQGLPVLPLRYLVLTKFQSGRVQDLADITRMLGQAGEDTLASVRDLFRRVLPEAQEDLESLIELGRLEVGPPDG